MGFCRGKTNGGACCSIVCSDGANYCKHHESQMPTPFFTKLGLGVAIGQLIFPGVGGAVAVSLGSILIEIFRRDVFEMAKKKVFVSFDFDEDKTLKEFIIQQARNSDSPFSVIDHSLKEAAPEKSWKDKARAAIRRSELVLVMVGPKTHKAPGVLAEVKMAREEGIPMVQVIGYKNGDYTAVPNAGRLYRWNWENLKNLLG